jgi:hypothetical protein
MQLNSSVRQGWKCESSCVCRLCSLDDGHRAYSAPCACPHSSRSAAATCSARATTPAPRASECPALCPGSPTRHKCTPTQACSADAASSVSRWTASIEACCSAAPCYTGIISTAVATATCVCHPGCPECQSSLRATAGTECTSGSKQADRSSAAAEQLNGRSRDFEQPSRPKEWECLCPIPEARCSRQQ